MILLTSVMTAGLVPPASAYLAPVKISIPDPLDPPGWINGAVQAPSSTSLYCYRGDGTASEDWACEVFRSSNFKANEYSIWYCSSSNCEANGYVGATDGTVDIQFSTDGGIAGIWCIHADGGIITNTCQATWGNGKHLVGGDIYHQAVTGYFATEVKRG